MKAASEKQSIGKAREHAINVYCNRVEGDRKTVILELYDTLKKTSPYAKHMQDSDMTADEMYRIAERLRALTGSGWLEAYYLPIIPFCRADSLKYLIAHKQDLLGNSGNEAFSEAYARLKRFFVTVFG